MPRLSTRLTPTPSSSVFARMVCAAVSTEAEAGSSPVAYPNPCRRCRTHSLLPGAGSLPVANGQLWESGDRSETWTNLQLDGDSLDGVVALEYVTS